METTSVSIIITTFNRAEHLKLTLEAMKLLLIPDGFKVELIVVDNGSTDGTANVIATTAPGNIGIFHLYEPETGQTNARNAAMRLAKGDILLWTDDDVRPPKDWIAQMCAPILTGKAMGVSGKIHAAPHLERDWMTRTHYDRLCDTRFMPEDFGSMIGANMAFHRDVLERVPDFDTELGPGKLGFMDDTLFSFRMRDAEYTIISLPDVFVEHHFDVSRLLYQSWLKNGEASGRSIAFVDYHWEHVTLSVPYLRFLLWKCALALFRALRRPQELTSEGCHRYEIRMVQNISYIQQYLIERKRPRKYRRAVTC